MRACVSFSLSRNRNNQNDQSKGITRRGKGTAVLSPHLWTPRLFWRKKDRYQNVAIVDLATVAEVEKKKGLGKKPCAFLLFHCALFTLLLVRVSMLYLTGRAVSRLANHVKAAQPRATNQKGEFLFSRDARATNEREVYIFEAGWRSLTCFFVDLLPFLPCVSFTSCFPFLWRTQFL